MKSKWLVGVVALPLLLGACQSSTKSTTPTTLSVQAQKNSAAAQQIVQGCLAKGNVLTKTGRQAVLSCIAPPGHEQAFMSCAQGKIATDGFVSKKQRQRAEQDLAVCVENNR